MQKPFICKNCGQKNRPNPRLRGRQAFCGHSQCQRARKCLWQKRKMAHDPVYRQQQLAALRDWRQNRPLHQYQSLYRERNPEYVQRNRELQRLRNQRYRQDAANCRNAMTARMNAIGMQLILTGIYLLALALCSGADMSKKIVKMDAFFSQQSVIKDVIGYFMPAGP